jgi:hypothetical protein
MERFTDQDVCEVIAFYRKKGWDWAIPVAFMAWYNAGKP